MVCQSLLLPFSLFSFLLCSSLTRNSPPCWHSSNFIRIPYRRHLPSAVSPPCSFGLIHSPSRSAVCRAFHFLSNPLSRPCPDLLSLSTSNHNLAILPLIYCLPTPPLLFFSGGYFSPFSIHKSCTPLSGTQQCLRAITPIRTSQLILYRPRLPTNQSKIQNPLPQLPSTPRMPPTPRVFNMNPL